MTTDAGARRWILPALLATTIVLALSCTRMPTAPRVPVLAEGRITGPADESVEGAYLYFYSSEVGALRFMVATTDSLGRYAVELFTGTYTVSIYPPADYATPSYEARVAFSTSDRRYDYRFQGVRVAGRVLGPTGAPIDSGQVLAFNHDQRYGSVRAALTNGAYSLLLPLGNYEFRARDANYRSGLPGRFFASVPISADTTIDIELGGIAVSGLVSGPDGLPMANVRVRADWMSQVYTAGDGRYLLYVPPGTYRIWFQPWSAFYIFPRVTDPLPIDAPTTVDCDLRGVEWTGTVRRAGTGEPLAGIMLSVRQAGDAVSRSASASSASAGEFRFILESDRSYDLNAYSPDVSRWVPILQGVAAIADTTFEIFIP